MSLKEEQMSSVMRSRSGIGRSFGSIIQAFVAAVGRLDKSLSPSVTLKRLRQHHFTLSDSIYLFHILLATFWLTVMQIPSFPIKLIIPVLYAIALLIPFTSQFFVPATPVFAWLLTYYSSRFIPVGWRPRIFVSLLPTLESVLYGANISDILTRFTHPILDIVAWLPYGVVHFTFPFVVAAFLWLYRSKEALHLWASTFGYLNLVGVIIQILLPCSAPWYEVIYGLTPANYSMKGSPGGLARIDALFGSSGYTTTFSNAPVVFGAFPSLHSACATIEALFISHFFPWASRYIWAYAGVLYWATMYLTHHYLIDVVGGACLATAFFYLFLPDDLRGPAALAPPGSGSRSKYEIYDLDDPRRTASRGLDEHDFDVSDASSDEEEDITYRSPVPGAGFGNGGGSNGSAVANSTQPFVKNSAKSDKDMDQGPGKKNHRHTASIASLIRGDERSPEDGWSPVTSVFTFPQNAGRGERTKD